MKISALVLTYNSGGLIDRCLDAVAAADVVDEVIVLDGGSTDGTPERAARRPGVRSVRRDGTKVSERLNEGFSQARNDLVLMLNDDAFVDPDTPARLAEVLMERPRAAVAGPRLRYEDGRDQRSAGRYKTLTDGVLTALSLQHLAARVRPAPVRPLPGTGLEQATWVAVCAAVVRKAAVEDIGGFDERYSFYSEDQDFARKLHESGWEMVVRRDAGAVHIGGGSTRAKEGPGPWFAKYYENRFLYFQKFYPRAWRIYALLWAVRASLHMVLWRARALRQRLRSDSAGERAAREWVAAFRQARMPPKATVPGER